MHLPPIQSENQNHIYLRCASVDITPQEPSILAACDHRDRDTPHEAVDDPLTAQLFLIEGSNHSCLVVTVDLLYAGNAITQACEATAAEHFPGASVMVFASHTHSACATDTSKPLLGRTSQRIVHDLSNRLSQGIIELTEMAPRRCTLEFRSTEVDLAINRRVHRVLSVDRAGFHFRTAVEGSNYAGPVDKTLSSITFRALDNREVLGVIVNFACHPVGYPHRRTISANFIAAIRAQVLAEVTSSDTSPVENFSPPIVGFVQGFSGDIRPKSTSTTRPARSGFRRWLAGPGYSDFTTRGYAKWTRNLQDRVSDLVECEPVVVTGGAIVTGTAAIPRTKVLLGSSSDSPFVASSLRIGPITFIGASGEMVTEYAMWLRQELVDSLLLLGGCMGDVVGYIPTEMMRRRGGYEADGFCRAFSARAVPEGVERSVRATLLESLRMAEVLPLGSIEN